MIVWWTASALAGAWTRDAGEAYVKAGGEVYAAVDFVNAAGAITQEEASYLGQQYSVYAEVGVIPGGFGQVMVKAPLVVGTLSTTYVDALGEVPLRANTTRPGDLEVGGQVRLMRKVPLALAVWLKVPMYANDSVGEDYPTFRELFPKPGDGNVDVTTWLYGGGAPGPNTFVEGGVGWRHRTEVFVGWDTPYTFADGVVFALKGGRRFGKVLPLIGVDGVITPVEAEFTREYVALFGTALIDVAKGVAIEPRISGEPWAEKASRGVAAGIGVSWRR